MAENTVIEYENETVKASVEAGIKPLVLNYLPFIRCDSDNPVAYRLTATLRSIIMGELTEKEYISVSDKKDCGIDLFKNIFKKAVIAAKKFKKAGRNIDFLAVHCPSSAVEKIDLYEFLAGIKKENPRLDPTRICLEFDEGVFEKDTESAKKALLDTKLLGFKTMIRGCGSETFPVSKMLTVSPDHVVLDPSFTEWAGSRNKPALVSSFISYLNSMNVTVYAEGTDEQRKAMRRLDCVGFMLKDVAPLTFEEAIAQKEAE